MTKVEAGPIIEEETIEDHAADLYHTKAQARRVQNLNSLCESDLDFFQTEGYLAVDQLFTPDQIRSALQAIDDLIAGKNPDFRGVQREASDADNTERSVRKLMNYVDFDTRLKEMATHEGILNLLRRLMGDEPDLFQDMALLKGPDGREKPWHQDCAYFNLPLDTAVIGVWIALDEATIQNGCLHILPGTHREGPVEHFKVRDWQICDTEVQTARDVAVPLPSGGALIWHGMVHHGSPINRSQDTRRALQFHYKPVSAGQTTTEERMQHFGGAVRGAKC